MLLVNARMISVISFEIHTLSFVVKSGVYMSALPFLRDTKTASVLPISKITINQITTRAY